MADMSKCGRMTDAELLRAINKEADEVLGFYPGCPKVFAAFDLVQKKLGLKTRDVMDALNQGLGSNYTSNVSSKWKRGAQTVPRNVERFMRAEILRCLYGEEGDLLAELLGDS